jgi:hypothetical protein
MGSAQISRSVATGARGQLFEGGAGKDSLRSTLAAEGGKVDRTYAGTMPTSTAKPWSMRWASCGQTLCYPSCGATRSFPENQDVQIAGAISASGEGKNMYVPKGWSDHRAR